MQPVDVLGHERSSEPRRRARPRARCPAFGVAVHTGRGMRSCHASTRTCGPHTSRPCVTRRIDSGFAVHTRRYSFAMVAGNGSRDNW